MLPRLLHNLLDYRIQHNAICFTLRATPLEYSIMALTYCRIPLHYSFWTRILNHNTTFYHTDSLIGVVVRSAPPVTLQYPVFPLRALKTPFFHYINFILTAVAPYGPTRKQGDLGLNRCTISGAGLWEPAALGLSPTLC